jgi:hypothetical protein
MRQRCRAPAAATTDGDGAAAHRPTGDALWGSALSRTLIRSRYQSGHRLSSSRRLVHCTMNEGHGNECLTRFCRPVRKQLLSYGRQVLFDCQASDRAVAGIQLALPALGVALRWGAVV